MKAVKVNADILVLIKNNVSKNNAIGKKIQQILHFVSVGMIIINNCINKEF